MAKELSIRCSGADSVSIHELRPFQDDIKTMTPSVLKKLENVLIQHGFSEPISVWGNSPDGQKWILNGHQRLTALQSLESKGWFIPPIPVAYVDAEDEFEARKKVLTLASQYGDFQQDHMAEFIAKAHLDLNWVKDNTRLAAGDFKWPVMVTPQDEDEVPPPPAVPTARLGDIYQLGRHRLMCGDSMSIDDVEKLMDGNHADMVYTDPPYGINEETDRAFAAKSRKAKGNTFQKIIGDDSIDTALSAYAIADNKSDIVCYWGGNYFAHKLVPSSCWVVWDKRVEEKDRDLNSDCELAYVKHPVKKSVRIFRHLWKGMIKASEHGEGRVHPTQKPVALAEWCFNELAPNSKTILDLFSGSGSTLIACEKTKRQCFMMELEPVYIDVIIQRWEALTGLKAELVQQASCSD